MSLLKALQASTEPPRERPSVLARFGITDTAVDPRDILYTEGKWGRSKEAVQDSEDLQRILKIQRRPVPSLEDQQWMADEMTRRLRWDSPACRCAQLSNEPCITHLLPVQGWYLYELAKHRGALGHIAVGGGKTGIDLLACMVVEGIKRAVLMIPNGLRSQLALDYERWSQHFRLPNIGGGKGTFYPDRPTLFILAYSELSRASCATYLKSHAPQMFILDESHNLKDPAAVRSSRFLTYIGEEQDTPISCCHSGSMTTDSLSEYGHLSMVCLRDKSPLPHERAALLEWCSAIDPREPSSPPGASIGALASLCEVGENVREGYRRRLLETPGVVATEDAQLPTKLEIHQRTVETPELIKALLREVRKSRQRPDGEVLVEDTEVSRACRQLAYGFFYRWKYPWCPHCQHHPMPKDPAAPCPKCRQHPAEKIDKWFSARQAWLRELRDRMLYRSTLMDSPELLTKAAARYHEGYEGDLPTWGALKYPAWAAISKDVHHEQETVWLDDFLVRDAARWAQEQRKGIIWYQHAAFGHALQKATGLPCYGPSDSQPVALNPTPAMLKRREDFIRNDLWEGDTAQNWIKTEDGSRNIIASMRAHGTGRNLQAFCNALITNVPKNEGIWEQATGRMHRRHQQADTVRIWVYRHTDEVAKPFDAAVEQARYVRQTTGKMEKLLVAKLVGIDRNS